ncbi:MAG: hypothetical protein QM676_03575 [Novosphingobium sp.]
MRLHPITLGAGAALAMTLCAAGAAGKPPRRPAAAAPAKPAQPSPTFSNAFPEAAAAPEAEAAAAAIGDVQPAPPEAAQPSDSGPSEAPVAPAAEALPSAEPSPHIEALPTTASDPARPPEPAPGPNEAAAGPKKGDPPSHQFMVGVWAEPGKSCETALDFKADGTLIGPFPRWELSEAGELTMVGNRQKIMLRVIDKDTMQSRRSETDPPRTLKRCP